MSFMQCTVFSGAEEVVYSSTCLRSAADDFRPVVALSPRVARGVGPLHDALLARQAGRERHRVLKVLALFRPLRNVELVLVGVVGQGQRVSVHAPLGGHLAAVVERAQLHLKVAPVVRRQLHVQSDVLKKCTK